MLDAYRVLDLTDDRGWMAGMLLAQLGADVVLVEPVGGWERTPSFRAYNRGKRSVVADSSAAVADLAADAHFLIDCGALPFEVDLEAIRASNPTLITVSLSPFGSDGPKADWRATDLTLVASSGQMICNGDADRPPVRISIPQAWYHASAQAVVGALVAHEDRARTGLGQHVDVSAQQATCETALPAILHGPAGLPAQTRGAGGLQVGEAFLRWVYDCIDGHVLITVSFGPMIGPMLIRFIEWMYEEGHCDDATREVDWVDFALHLQTGEATIDQLNRLLEQIAEFAATKTKAEFLTESIARTLLITPVTDLQDVLDSPQMAEREFWDEIDGVRYPGRFIVSAQDPISPLAASPATPGEHTAEVAAPTAALRAPQAPGHTGRPLEGLKVLDFSWVAAAPLTTKILAHWGATVVRIETSLRPDLTRVALGHFDDVADQEAAITWQSVNAGKRGIALNLAKPEARRVVMDLAAWADLALESFTPGTLEKMGYGYDALREVNPGIILASSCVMGQTGPLRDFAGFGNLAACAAGFYDVTGWPDRPAAGPYMAYTDYTSPRFTAAALLAAVDHQRRTGEGQYLDFSQMEAATHFLAAPLVEMQETGIRQTRAGNDDLVMVPHGVFPAEGTERWIAIACEDDDMWRALAAEMRRADLADLTTAQRRGRREELEAIIAAWTAGQDAGGLQSRLQLRGIAAHQVQNTGECMNDPQLVHRGHFQWAPHPEVQWAMVDAMPYQLSRSPGGFDWAGPTYGQHTMWVLEDLLGYDIDTISELAVAEVLE